ncbi:MAG: Flp family type IVb pilin [Actinobacteria bacterium]|nr:Flp family type IVb pilin [Actinomycetota bacterium]
MVKLLMSLWTEESGQGMAEYGLILALVAVVTIAAFQLLGTGIKTKVNEVGTSIRDAGTTPP